MHRPLGHALLLLSGLTALALAVVTVAFAAPAAQPATGQVKVEWFGWSHYRFTSPTGKVVLTNPFTSNPDSPIKPEDIARADLIVVADGHGDEVGSTVAIAQNTGATVLAPGGLNSWLVEQGIPRAQVPKNFFQPGDRYTGLQGITVRSVESVHGSELAPPTAAVPYGGVAAGYFITFENGWTVYFSGSSAATAEQGMWATMYKPNLAILHMGADTEPIDFAEQVKMISSDNPNLTTVFPHHNRVDPPAGQTRVSEVQAAMDAMGVRMQVTQPPLGQAVMFPDPRVRLTRALVALGVAISVSLVPLLALPDSGGAQTEAQNSGLLAIVGRQVAWLNLEAPRHRPVSRFPAASNALEVTAQADQSHVVVAVGAAFPGAGGTRGADLVNLDLASGDMSPLLARAQGSESLDSPAWWSDGATLLFERQDLGGQTVSPPGQEVPRYPSRIERVMADGSGRGVLLPDGRQPSASPDGTRLVFARSRNQGASLMIWSQADGSLQTLVPEGRFADVAYPQFSPRSDQVAFVAPQSGLNGRPPGPQSGLNGRPPGPQSGLNGRPPGPLAALDGLFGPTIAYAHGIPWDPYVVNADGSGLRRVAETGADEPSVVWSPDESQLFVYSGTGSFLVDLATSTVTPLSFVQGYGPVAWVNPGP